MSISYINKYKSFITAAFKYVRINDVVMSFISYKLYSFIEVS